MGYELSDNQMRAIAAAYGGGANNAAPDPTSAAQQSLLGGISGIGALLAQRQAEQSQLGGNALLTQGQDAANEATGQVAQQMAAQAPAAVQNRSANPDPGFMAQLQALMLMGPQQAQGNLRGDTRWGAAAIRTMNEKYRQDYLNKIADVAGMADLMRGPMTPLERQQAQDAANLGHVGATNSLLASAQPREINNPQLLAMGMEQAGKLGAAEVAAQGDMNAAKTTAAAAQNNKALEIKGELAKQGLANQGALDVENAKQGADAATKADEEFNKQIQPITNAQTSLQTVASDVVPELIKSAGNWFSSPEKEKGISLLTRLDGAINQSREAVFGKDYVKSELAKTGASDPTKVSALVTDALVDNMMKLEISTGLARAAKQQGKNVKPGTPEFNNLMGTVLQTITPQQVADTRTKIWKQYPWLVPSGNHDKAALKQSIAKTKAQAALAQGAPNVGP